MVTFRVANHLFPLPTNFNLAVKEIIRKQLQMRAEGQKGKTKRTLSNTGGVVCVWFQVTMDPRQARWTGSSIIKS